MTNTTILELETTRILNNTKEVNKRLEKKLIEILKQEMEN